jgi:ribosomal protein S25
MGQGDIIEVLKREKRKMTTKEIANKCKVGISCTHVKLRKLRELGEIDMIKKGNKYFYKLK